MSTKQNTDTCELIVGLFEDPKDAQNAVRELRDAGFDESQIGVAHRSQDVEKYVGDAEESEAGEGAAVGALAGAGVGSLWAIGIAAGMVPAIGPAVAGGLLGSVLASAAGAAATGGLVGALIGLGIPDDKAEEYEEELKKGRILVTVHPGEREDTVFDIMKNNHVYNLDDLKAEDSQFCETATDCGSTQSSACDSNSVVRKEEELNVERNGMQTEAEAHVHKDVVTEHKTVEVPVKREELVVERRTVNEDDVCDSDFGEKEVRIPLREEEVHVEKETVAKEEVSLGKRTVTDSETYEADLRKERVEVEVNA